MVKQQTFLHDYNRPHFYYDYFHNVNYTTIYVFVGL